MSNFYISDLHFGHANIMTLCKRPFKSVAEMNKIFVENWNRVVGENDNVYILGDFAFRGIASEIQDILEKLHGKKFLIFGNHDKAILQFKQYFVWIKDYAEIEEGTTRLVLSHYPMVEWNGYFRGTIHLYGHIHNNINNAAKVMSKIGNAYNVGADILDFTPQPLSKVIELNKKFWKQNNL